MNLATKVHQQQIHDLIQTLRYEAGLSKRITAHLRGLEKDLLGAYLNAGDITSQRKLKALLDEARAAIADRYDAAKGLYDDEIPKLAEIGANKAVAALNGAIKVDIFSMSLTTDQINTIASDVLIQGAPSAEWWGLQEAETLRKFKNAVRGGMLRGATGDEMAREVRDLMQTSMRNAQTLVRTSVITVNNAAHEAAYEANADLMEGIQWLSTLDSRTTLICMGLDGLTWDMQKNPIGHDKTFPGPTAHWGCRSTQLPITKSWEQLAREAHGNSTLAKQLDAMSPSTRASMDGQVSAKTTYEDWLSTRPEAMQKEILGPARYRLLESGKLKLSDLTDMRGNELTLKELARL